MSYASMLRIFLAPWACSCPGNAHNIKSTENKIRHDRIEFLFGIGSDSPFVRDPFRKDFSPLPSKIDGYINALD
jgi:hypothetical protein